MILPTPFLENIFEVTINFYFLNNFHVSDEIFRPVFGPNNKILLYSTHLFTAFFPQSGHGQHIGTTKTHLKAKMDGSIVP